jgi:hypothetical protein
MAKQKEHASFRDNAGFVFYCDGIAYRRINIAYRETWEQLMNSGLYERLIAEGLLIPHEIVDVKEYWDESAFLTIKPRQIPFIVYPFEWSFSQLKDAALATLKILERAFEYEMTLRDASAYNIQFIDGKPLLIDTLSLGIYREGEPWGAYGQFCRHFLGPLSLTVFCGSDLTRSLQKHALDGIDLALVSRLLPLKTRFFFGLGMHIHLHSKKIKDSAITKAITIKRNTVFSEAAFQGLFSNLTSCIKKLRSNGHASEWSEYYDEFSYSLEAFTAKKNKVSEFLIASRQASTMVFDIGANNGEFSRIAAEIGYLVISADSDGKAIEQNYQITKSCGEKLIIPCIADIVNPSPALGWENQERTSFIERVRNKNPIVLALAIIHHMVIGNNISINQAARFFSSLGPVLIIEYISKQDQQTQRLLVVREDIFTDYNQMEFEKTFSLYFLIKTIFPIPGTERVLYLMIRK